MMDTIDNLETRERPAEVGGGPEHAPLLAPRRRGWRGLTIFGIVALTILVAVAALGITIRRHKEAVLVRQTEEAAIPTVDPVSPQQGVNPRPLVLPGEIAAFYTAPIYSQVSGYVKMWYKDIGARVKAGDVLAYIETPGLDQELERAKAELAEAQANVKLAQVTAVRWRKLLTTQSVSQEEADVKAADAQALEARAQAAAAHVSRVEALEGFKKLVAPFDGIVTARKVHPGELVTADQTNRPELFEVSDIQKVRVYVKVPQAYTAGIHPGMDAKLDLPQYPNKMFDAKLITVSNAIDPASRTELVELLADNPLGELTPGTFTEVHFELPPNPDAVRIPTSALIFQEHGLQVAVVGPNDRIELKNIRAGVDLGTEIEVVDGLRPGERVVNSPPATLFQGELVRVETQAQPASGTKAASEPEGK
jgi:RND family efflux transporter MFP subunit